MIGWLWCLAALAGAEEMPEMVRYQMVLLEKGPKWTADESAELSALQEQHLAHLDAAWKAGQAEVCGPVEDPSGTLRGLCVYATDSSDTALDWASKDPMVLAGHLAVRVVPWWTGAGVMAFPLSSRHAAPAGAGAHGGPPAGPHGPPKEGAHHGGGHKPAGGDHATVHHRFDDVQRWIKVFDDPERLQWQKPEVVVASLGLEKKMAVADIGAGTGFFNPYLAAAVGKKGKVIPIDVERTLVDHMTERAVVENTPMVQPRLGRFEDPGLLKGEVDRILMVDTYHHIDSRKDYFGRLVPALKPGGQLIVVDFKPGDLPVGPKGKHKISPEQVVSEMQAAGWKLVEQPEVLPYQYVLVFEPTGD